MYYIGIGVVDEEEKYNKEFGSSSSFWSDS